jgi:hypothetical protein
VSITMGVSTTYILHWLLTIMEGAQAPDFSRGVSELKADLVR